MNLEHTCEISSVTMSFRVSLVKKRANELKDIAAHILMLRFAVFQGYLNAQSTLLTLSL